VLAGLLSDKELTFDVDREDVVDFDARHFVEIAKMFDAGIALVEPGERRPSGANSKHARQGTYHDDIDSPELLFRFYKQPSNVLVV
jgi:hypothetical protein